MEVREAHPYDWRAIEALTRRTRFTSPALWQWEAHLTDQGFLVMEIEGRVEGALLATVDESPVAWVRLAAVGDHLDVGQWMDLSLPPIISHLRTLEVRELAWMDHGEWAWRSLERRGFQPRAEVITLRKTDHAVPTVDPPPIALRPASDADFAAIAAIDRRAFAPAWWRSEDSLRRRAAMASRFTVAERGDDVIGYAERELHPPAAHLNRIAVEPDHQGRNVGAFLLERALVSMWQRGAETVSLNTQRSNRRSRRLYESFGFEATGHCVTVWMLQL